MPYPLQAALTVLGRVLLSAIFGLSVMGKISDFAGTAAFMDQHGVPAAPGLLVGATVFLVAGSLSVVLGFRARIGAALLLVFLVLATYFFHNFWALEGPQPQAEMVQFLKNLSMMGALVFLIANGSGPASLDGLLSRRSSAEFEREPAGAI
jgi:putative oxidoreductase